MISKVRVWVFVLLISVNAVATAQETTSVERYEGEHFSLSYPTDWRLETTPTSVRLFYSLDAAQASGNPAAGIAVFLMRQDDFFADLSTARVTLATELTSVDESYIFGAAAMLLSNSMSLAVSLGGGDSLILHDIEAVGDMRIQRITSPNAPAVGYIFADQGIILYSYAYGEPAETAFEQVLAIAESIELTEAPDDSTPEASEPAA